MQIERKVAVDTKDVVVPVSKKREDNYVTWQEFKANIKTIARSSLIGQRIKSFIHIFHGILLDDIWQALLHHQTVLPQRYDFVHVLR